MIAARLAVGALEETTMQRDKKNSRQLAALLACIAMPVVIHATEVDDGMPPPGLYRVDIVGTITSTLPGNAGIQMRSDGRTGDEVERPFANGHVGGDVVVKGNGPQTHCVGPRAVSALPDMPGCVGQPGVRTKDGWVMKSKCASVDSTLVIRKIDGVTWEYDTTTTLFQPNAGDTGGMMRLLLEQQARNAATAEERQKAAKALTELPEIQRQMAQAQARSMDDLARMERDARTPEEAAMIQAGRARVSGQAPVQEQVARMRWTRIADACDAAPKVK